MVSAKDIQTALERVRDTQETVAVGPFTFRHEKTRGLDFCHIETRWIGRDVFAGTDHGPIARSSHSGFAFGCAALKRVSDGLAKQSAQLT